MGSRCFANSILTVVRRFPYTVLLVYKTPIIRPNCANQKLSPHSFIFDHRSRSTSYLFVSVTSTIERLDFLKSLESYIRVEKMGPYYKPLNTVCLAVSSPCYPAPARPHRKQRYTNVREPMPTVPRYVASRSVSPQNLSFPLLVTS
jgi:hypothetical protein